MGFMVAEMTEFTEWLFIATNSDSVIVELHETGLDADDVARINSRLRGDDPNTSKDEHQDNGDQIPPELRDFVSGQWLSEELVVVEGWGVRSSAPGYMDCTEWEIFTDLEEATEAYREQVRLNNGDENTDEEANDEEE